MKNKALEIYEDAPIYIDPKTVLETKDNGATHIRLKHFLLDVLEKPTKNNTYYSRDMIPLEQARNQAMEGTLFSYLDHTFPGQPPSDGNRLEKACMTIDALEWEESDDGLRVYADATVLNEGAGKIVKELLQLKKPIGFSKRGSTERFMEQMVDNKKVKVPQPYAFHAWDTVTGQSVSEAQTNIMNIVTETLNSNEEIIMENVTLESIMKDEALWAKVLEKAKEQLSETTKTLIAERIDEAKKDLDSKIEEKLTPVQEEKKALENVLKEIGEALVKAKIVDVREAS